MVSIPQLQLHSGLTLSEIEGSIACLTFISNLFKVKNMDSTTEIPQPPSKVQETIERLATHPIFIEARQILDNQPPWVSYHKRAHSEDVLRESLIFAVEDGIENDEDLELVALISITHDIGIPLGKVLKGHEAVGAAWVGNKMRESGYSEDKIKIVTDTIEDSQIRMVDGRLVQGKARHELGKYPLDGDLSNLGRDDFQQNMDPVFVERKAQEPGITTEQCLVDTYNLISNHEWQSESAKSRQSKQEDNKIKLQQEIASLL